MRRGCCALCPCLKARKRLSGMAPGGVLRLIATDPAAVIDVPHFCAEAGHELISDSRGRHGAGLPYPPPLTVPSRCRARKTRSSFIRGGATGEGLQIGRNTSKARLQRFSRCQARCSRPASGRSHWRGYRPLPCHSHGVRTSPRWPLSGRCRQCRRRLSGRLSVRAQFRIAWSRWASKRSGVIQQSKRFRTAALIVGAASSVWRIRLPVFFSCQRVTRAASNASRSGKCQ